MKFVLMAITPATDLIVEDLTSLRPKPNDQDLVFGKVYTDRMLLREYKNGAWQTGRILPYQNFSLDPATLVFHYGQEIFEGLKAFRQENGNIVMFRPDENAKRFGRSASRMMMPVVPEDYFLESISKLINLEREWVPKTKGYALYIRPTMIATEAILGVRPSKEYYFYTILSPSGPYFKEGFSPTKIKVEDEFVRASIGGTGEAKAGGNYAGTLMAAARAKEEGYSQVLWLDARERKYIEEVGAMNIAFVLDNEIITPRLTGSILEGITRKSVIQIAKDLGYKMTEKDITIDTVAETINSGNLTEIFGIGTAASIAPVGEIMYKSKKLIVNDGKVGPITQAIYEELIGIQYGSVEDKHGWIHLVE